MTHALSSVRVVTMALNAPGPAAVWRLRNAGATVIKVEPPTGDPLETYAPGWYRELHEGIKVERLDLKGGDGGQRMRALLADADLFLASQRPSALARLGLDADTLLHEHSRFRHLRWLNIVGDVQAPEIPGHDLTYLAKAGLLGREMPRTLVADLLAGEHAFATALLLLRQPPGSQAQVGLYDTLAPLAAPLRHGLTGHRGILGGGLPAYGIYDTREGRIAIAALETRFRQRLYDALQLPMDSELASVFATRSAHEWERWAAEHDLPVVVVRD
jgi:crotonobetainyl-CoA:carnitine CoA-transferase CaiB-like acyl-CoA transferase